MVQIRRKSVDSHYEEQITIGMIMSAKFLIEIKPLFNPEYMRSTFAKIVCGWCIDYYERYKKAPKANIKDIFIVESETNLEKQDAEIIQSFLTRLSKQFTSKKSINYELIKDFAFDYFRKRDLEIRSEKTKKLLELGKVEEAEDQFLNFKRVAFQTSGWIDPFSVKEIIDVFDSSEDATFTFPGALGELVGPVERNWLIGILGVFKRGKSFFMQEIGVRAIFQDLKVVFVSLEMSPKDVKQRFYRRLTGFGSKTGEDVFLFPVFDCIRNQNGSCIRPERTNLARLLEPDGSKPEYDINTEYKPCTYCRGHRIRDYAMTTWYEPLEVPQFSLVGTRKRITAIRSMYGDNFRYICYPRFTASVTDIKRDLFILEQHEGFIPDMIIVDHADILKPDTKGEKRNQIDDTWKVLASMAAERHAIVVTASQGTRGAIYKEDISQDDLAEWIGKLGHVDLFVGLSQTSEEKSSSVLRANVLAHRHRNVDEHIFAVMLQQLDVGQFLLDSYLKRKNERLPPQQI